MKKNSKLFIWKIWTNSFFQKKKINEIINYRTKKPNYDVKNIFKEWEERRKDTGFYNSNRFNKS